MSAPPSIGQLIGESALLTVRTCWVWRARVKQDDIHPGNVRLAETRAEWSGYQHARQTIGRHIRRAVETGLLEWVRRGGGKPNGGRAANVLRFTARGARAIAGTGDFHDAEAVATSVPRRYLVRFASQLNGRAAWIQALGGQLSGPLKQAVQDAHEAAQRREAQQAQRPRPPAPTAIPEIVPLRSAYAASVAEGQAAPTQQVAQPLSQSVQDDVRRTLRDRYGWRF